MKHISTKMANSARAKDDMLRGGLFMPISGLENYLDGNKKQWHEAHPEIDIDGMPEYKSLLDAVEAYKKALENGIEEEAKRLYPTPKKL